MAELTGMVSSEQYNKVILSLSPFENESNCWRKSIIVSLLDGKSISDECLTKNDCSGYVLLYLEKYIKICRGKTTRRVSYIKKSPEFILLRTCHKSICSYKAVAL
jgi:hypothetical protein